MRERHRLGRGGRLVEQRRVGDVHRGEVLHRRLEVEQRLEAALGDLGLVRRVGRVPARVLEDVAQDHGRRDRVVVAEADEGAEDLVLRRAPSTGARGSRARARPAAAAADRGGGCRPGWPGRGAPRPTARRWRRASRPVRPRSARCAGRRSPARCVAGQSLAPAAVPPSADERPVGGGVEQRAELAGVRRLHLDDPGAVRILVDRFGRRAERVVDRDRPRPTPARTARRRPSPTRWCRRPRPG